jgi:hypothetical protein
VTGFLLALCAAVGVALIWLGAVLRVRPQLGTDGLRAMLAEAEVRVRPVGFMAGCLVAGIAAGLIALMLVGVPVLALAAAAAGAWTPLGWVRRRRERNRRERERAWPAVLGQLADALEAGIAFPGGGRAGRRVRSGRTARRTGEVCRPAALGGNGGGAGRPRPRW